MPDLERKIIELKVPFLVSGMELASDVCSSHGNILVNQGTIITQAIIKKLETWNVEKASVIAEIAAAPIEEPLIKKFLTSYNQSVSVVHEAFDTIRETREIPLETFQKTATDLAQNAIHTGNIIDRLYDLPPSDDYTFHHSVNVSIIAALLASWLKYPVESIRAISLTGLLHDVGKSLLPPELLNKPYKLSRENYEKYKQHTILGYDLINKVPGIAQSIKLGITDHHEREDGSGYPRQLKSSEIHTYAKIIAVADQYDEALTINKVSKNISPYGSIEKLRDELHRLDAKVCLTFINHMINFLSGNLVMLTNGAKGRVVFLNHDSPCRSVVQLEDGTIMDLRENTEVRIEYVTH